MFDHCWIQLLQTSKLLFGSLATPPFITARFQFIVLINCKTQQIEFELKYFPKMVSKMFRIDRKTIPIKYFPFQTDIHYFIFSQNFVSFYPSKSKVCCKKLAENPWWFGDRISSQQIWRYHFSLDFSLFLFLQHFELSLSRNILSFCHVFIFSVGVWWFHRNTQWQGIGWSQFFASRNPRCYDVSN